MALAAGTNLDHYEIRCRLGAGAMGEVYRAHDNRLERDVAIKVLPASFSNDEDRLKRFEQEARAASALNHPNILTVHDFGRCNGSPYIVTELLDGEELRSKLKGVPIPQRIVIDYAQQIASGLAAAHSKGIVHRDLKPENIFITTDGRVKMLDFGLSKIRPAQTAPGTDENGVTKTAITDPGVIVGTAGYMSPEQVLGQPVDHRADIFSFGITLYEMLSGRRPFPGDSSIAVMNAILKEEPSEFGEANTAVSPALEKIVRRCLEKNPERRFQSTSDLCFAIEALSAQSGPRLDTPAILPSSIESDGELPLLGNARLAWTAAGILLVLTTLVFAWAYLSHVPSGDSAAMRFRIPSPIVTDNVLRPMISPDGRSLVFATSAEGKRQLWLRRMDALEAHPIPGTEGGFSPFWSPDSRSVAFFADGKLKKLDLGGGAPLTLCDLPSGTGGSGTWSREGTILFFEDPGVIYRIAAAGGEPTPVGPLEGSRPKYRRAFPYFLPDGRHYLFYSGFRDAPGVYAASIDEQGARLLVNADSGAIYGPSKDGSGWLLFRREFSLLAQPFDATNLKLTGEPLPVAVQIIGPPSPSCSVSNTGILTYTQGRLGSNQQVTWIDRAGTATAPVIAKGDFQVPRLSPDGKRMALGVWDSKSNSFSVHVVDLVRGVSSRLTFGPAQDSSPIWSPDGSRIAWGRQGQGQICRKSASGAGQDEVLLQSNAFFTFPTSWSPNGKFILYHEMGPKTNRDVWVLPLDGDRKPFPFLQTPFDEDWAVFSPDGRWVAYQSDESGSDEVYVQTFPASSNKWQVSARGGFNPQWRADGKELFYRSTDGRLMSVKVKTGKTFEAAIPRPLVNLSAAKAAPGASVFPSPDGQRFLVITETKESPTFSIAVVLNWTAGLKR